jgi:hypothetical protein
VHWRERNTHNWRKECAKHTTDGNLTNTRIQSLGLLTRLIGRQYLKMVSVSALHFAVLSLVTCYPQSRNNSHLIAASFFPFMTRAALSKHSYWKSHILKELKCQSSLLFTSDTIGRRSIQLRGCKRNKKLISRSEEFASSWNRTLACWSNCPNEAKSDAVNCSKIGKFDSTALMKIMTGPESYQNFECIARTELSGFRDNSPKSSLLDIW